MIIGNGMIANIFKKYKYKDVVIFASGVSNSNEKDKLEFLREKKMLEDILDKYKNKQFIYFSSCSLEDVELQNTPYHIHKKEIEVLIKHQSKNYLIFRLPNIIGNLGNENTIVNFFINKIKNHEEFSIWKNATRNIVDIEDLGKIVSHIIDEKKFINKVINIAYDNNIKIFDLLYAIEYILDKKAIYQIEHKGVDIKIDNNVTKQVMTKLLMKQPSIVRLINKYKGI